MLSLSSKLAINTLVFLTQQDKTCFLKVPQIAEGIGVPAPYLAKVVKRLGKEDLVETRRGPGGGIRIAQRGKEANFYEICRIFNESIVSDACFLHKKGCNSNSPCPMHHDWTKTRTAVLAFLKERRISDLSTGSIDESIALPKSEQ